MSALLSSLFLAAAWTHSQPAQIPALANVLGLKLGQATVEEVEKKLGKGLASTGGHPNGRRTWYDPKLKILIDLDGFDYSREGRLIDGLNLIAQADTAKKVPRVTIDPAAYGVWGPLFRKPRATVLSFLQKKQWAYNASPEAILLHQTGKLTHAARPSYAELTYTSWRAVLTFREDKLCSVLLSVE